MYKTRQRGFFVWKSKFLSGSHAQILLTTGSISTENFKIWFAGID